MNKNYLISRTGRQSQISKFMQFLTPANPIMSGSWPKLLKAKHHIRASSIKLKTMNDQKLWDYHKQKIYFPCLKFRNNANIY